MGYAMFILHSLFVGLIINWLSQQQNELSELTAVSFYDIWMWTAD